MLTEKECIAAVRAAIKQFGEYNYFDKGPQEVMDIPAFAKKTSDMTAVQIADVFAAIRQRKYGEEFVRTMLVELQEYPAMDALYEDARLADLY